MRAAVWREIIRKASPEQLVAAAVLAATKADQRNDAGRLAWHALARELDASVEARVLLRRAAGPDHHPLLSGVLAGAEAVRVAQADEIRSAPLLPDRDVTLGERRSWARRHDRSVLQKLLGDQDLGVIRNLLQNPRLIERDVLRIASRRPTTGEVLQLVFRNPRWGRRPAVKEALVLNPYTPVALAVSLVALLPRPVVERLRSEPGVHGEVRARAIRALDPLPAEVSVDTPEQVDPSSTEVDEDEA